MQRGTYPVKMFYSKPSEDHLGVALIRSGDSVIIIISK